MSVPGAQVLPDRTAQQAVSLRDVDQGAACGGRRLDRPAPFAVERHRPLLRTQQPQQQADQRTLPGSRGPDDGRGAPGAEIVGETFEDVAPAVRIGKGDVAATDTV